jgi:hypothetical protein
MPATGTFRVINLYPWHGSLSQKDFEVIDLVRKCDFLLYSKQILDSRCWMVASSIQYPASAPDSLSIVSKNL